MPDTQRLYRVLKEDGTPLRTGSPIYSKKPKTYDKQSTAQALATRTGGRVQYADVIWKELNE